ncbi:hypothetical protein PENSPDRAFT_659668 [Peniophora sp. CONT]|nr:hypothetical protein PENSPDRAFT_659668 [Peniophora sp. CONT]
MSLHETTTANVNQPGPLQVPVGVWLWARAGRGAAAGLSALSALTAAAPVGHGARDRTLIMPSGLDGNAPMSTLR